MSRLLGHPRILPQDYVLPVLKGGTGSSTAQGAAEALSFLKNSDKGAPNGVVTLDTQGKLSASNLVSANDINLTGSTEGYVLTPQVFTISDYDSFKSYNVSVSVGTVARNGGVITYTPPSTPQVATLTINDRNVQINILDSQPGKPTISSPTNGAININETPTIVASAFVTYGVAQTHLNTDWQIATDAEFTNIVQNYAADAVNKVSRKLTALNVSTQYFVRVRYRSSVAVGAWSDTVSFTTKAVFIPGVESAKLTMETSVTGYGFARSVHMSADGNRVIVGAPVATDTLPQQGVAYIFVKVNSSWQIEKKLVSIFPRAGGAGQYGISVRLDATGTRAFIGEQSSSDGGTGGGAIDVWIRNTTTNVWTAEARLTASNTLYNNYGVGDCIETSSDGSVVVSGRYNTVVNSTGLGSSGCVFTWTRSGTSWTFGSLLIPAAPDVYYQSAFGTIKALSPNGNRLIVAVANTPDGTIEPNGAPGSFGALFIYNRSGGTWSFYSKLFSPSPTRYEYFGCRLAMSRDGSRLAVRSGSGSGNSKVRIYNTSSYSVESEIDVRNTSLNESPNNSYDFDADNDDMCISNDGNTLTVGMRSAPVPGPTGPSSGKVVVFKRTGGVWARAGYFNASDLAASDYYGMATSMLADASQMIVGAGYKTVDGISQRGAAYIVT